MLIQTQSKCSLARVCDDWCHLGIVQTPPPGGVWLPPPEGGGNLKNKKEEVWCRAGPLKRGGADTFTI